MSIVRKVMTLVCYGCGDAFDPVKFQPVCNQNTNKPRGGLWTSPVKSEYGWWEWATENDFGDLSTRFVVEFNGSAITIDSFQDLMDLPLRSFQPINQIDDVYRTLWFACPDYEIIARYGAQAIHLTVKGQNETRLSCPSLYGWDCETVFVMDVATLRPVTSHIRRSGLLSNV